MKESPVKVGVGTVEKFTTENMGTAVGILSLGGTEPDMHPGSHLLPHLQRTCVKIPLQHDG